MSISYVLLHRGTYHQFAHDHQRAHMCVRVCTRLFGCPRIPRRNVRALSVGMDCVWFGLQAFESASTFNANIGAWNIALVATLSGVCAAYGLRRAITACGTQPHRTCSVGVRCGAALARVCAHTSMHSGCAGAHVCMCSCEEDGIYVCIGYNRLGLYMRKYGGC